ncbi:GH25 family lysozyme [Lachnoclostridium sp. Marseille-P6806]|uniref:GH25 family lysozyme n=1 Tax=Lachnoclostridium sp. Marseille-P6806 TaxID=2364793 RepID=UPI00102F9C02|nr:GH25 family lysozyme [Lachnoclostridium sp. Marseille-P6806]
MQFKERNFEEESGTFYYDETSELAALKTEETGYYDETDAIDSAGVRAVEEAVGVPVISLPEAEALAGAGFYYDEEPGTAQGENPAEEDGRQPKTEPASGADDPDGGDDFGEEDDPDGGEAPDAGEDDAGESPDAEDFADDGTGEDYVGESPDAESFADDGAGEDFADDEGGASGAAGILAWAARLTGMDYVIAGTAALVVGALVLFGLRWNSDRIRQNGIASFASIGAGFETGTAIGADKIAEVAEARIEEERAAAEAAELAAKKAAEEAEIARNRRTVVVRVTSILKDLKIKFVDESSGTLITGVPFIVRVTGPDGKTNEYTNDDRDGIIYKKDIAGGAYTVGMVEFDDTFEDAKYYRINTETQTIQVKEKLEYQKVDVSDEIKSESEINVAKEDTAQQNTVVESVNKDTVEWVESTRTELSEGESGGISSNEQDYVAVPKSEVPNPQTSAGRNRGRADAALRPVQSAVSAEPVSMSMNAAWPGVSAENLLVTAEIYQKTELTEAPVSEEPSEEEQGETEPAEKTVTGVTLNPGTLSGTKGGSASLTVTVSWSDGSTSAEADWSSDHADIASVDGGVVTYNAPGTATITASKGEHSASCSVTVSEEKTVYSLTMSGSSSFKKGESTTLSPALSPSRDGVSYSWSTGNAGVAKVDGGKVTGVAAGTADIICRTTIDGTEYSAKLTVTVTEEGGAVEISLSPSKVSLTVGAMQQLTAKISNATNGSVEWSSSDNSVATVGSDGVVKGVKAGSATITATAKADSSKTASSKVTVTAAGSGYIVLDPGSVSIAAGNYITVTATVYRPDKTKAENQSVSWSSSDAGIASVDGGKITAIKTGSCTVTAVSQADGSVKAEITVTVKANTTKLRDKDGNQLYVRGSDGSYRTATVEDYAQFDTFYRLANVTKNYRYTGWQTIGGRTYFFDKNGNFVTGDQIIQGAKYSFAADGTLNTGGAVLGIDVSKWNGNINWTAVANSGVKFVIIRCGYRGSTLGALIEDSRFRSNIAGAAAAGLKVGVYFFSQAIDEVEAVEEASMVLSLIGGYKISYPVFLDLEDSGGRADGLSAAARTKVAAAFCRTIQNSGYKSGIYANKTWLGSRMNVGSLASYHIWLAQYAASPTYSASRYDIWQYSAKGSVAGISGNVDMNLSYMGY